MLDARLDANAGDVAAVDRLVAAAGPAKSGPPMLLYAPAIRWAVPPSLLPLSGRRETPAAKHLGEWVDIGFRIRSDGTVENAFLLRESDGRSGGWVEPVLASLRARRYAPLTGTALLRVERHTYTASFGADTGSRLRVQTGRPRVVVMDLTSEMPTDEVEPRPPRG